MSGGQGSDETRAEALVMKEYAIEQGYSEELIITEEKSKNTLENMKFSKAVMEEKAMVKTINALMPAVVII